MKSGALKLKPSEEIRMETQVGTFPDFLVQPPDNVDIVNDLAIKDAVIEIENGEENLLKTFTE